MLLKDKVATIDYLEFTLMAFLEEIEPHVDSEYTGQLYAKAASLLNDIDETMDIAVENTNVMQGQI